MREILLKVGYIKMAGYFVIYQNDTEATVMYMPNKKDVALFLEELQDNKDECLTDKTGNPIFMDATNPDTSTDPQYWGGVLIIKGTVVIPQPKKVVQEWEL